MNILLVDDEAYVIESIRRNVDWSRVGASKIYTANSMHQAMTVMEIIAIQVIICDIVMPEGSGFEFMEWVRAEEYPVKVIFLTSYAEFDYARRAIALDFVKLTRTIQRAVEESNKEQRMEEYRTDSEKWLQSKRLIHKTFLMLY